MSQRWVTKNKASHHGYALACLQVVPVCTCGSSEDVCSDVREFGGYQGVQRAQKQKKNLRQHSVLDWSPTSILSGPCDACLRGSDETRKVHRGMAADKERGQRIVQTPTEKLSPIELSLRTFTPSRSPWTCPVPAGSLQTCFFSGGRRRPTQAADSPLVMLRSLWTGAPVAVGLAVHQEGEGPLVVLALIHPRCPPEVL